MNREFFRRIALVALAFPALTASVIAEDAADGSRNTPVSDFVLKDYRGRNHQLSEYADAKVVVLAFLGTECPLVKLYGPRLQQLATRYQDKGVVFLGINPNRQDSISDIAAYARRHGVTFPILKDVGNKIADAAGVERTPEVVVLDAERRIQFRGRIDDQYGVGYSQEQPRQQWLVDAITAALAGQSPDVRYVEAEGCLIGRLRKTVEDSHVTYGSHIAGILNKHCVQCHRAGEIAPFELTDYDEVAGWADMIREVTRDNRMPPWHADPAHGHFANARGLSDEEKRLIDQWVLNGAPAGDLSRLPTLPAKADGWQLEAEPDKVVWMPEAFTVPAEGTVRYKYFTAETEFTEDRWVKAAEVVPDSRDVVHHILVFVKSPEARRRNASGAGGGSFLAAYVPGLRTAPYPQGMAKLIPAGSQLVFQMHYTPVGEERTDRSKIGFYFADDSDVDHVVLTQETLNRDFQIPPNDANYRVEETSRPSPAPGKLLALMPHMHLRGKSFRYEALLPDGRQKTLLDVPAYDFNWQTAYRLNEPLDFPVGTKMQCIAHFDNSAGNLNNPDPSSTVGWGDQTWDEMMIGYYDVAVSRNVLEPRRATAKADDATLTSRSDIMQRFDKNKNGVIERSEVPRKLLVVFTALDANKNDPVDMEELKRLPNQR